MVRWSGRRVAAAATRTTAAAAPCFRFLLLAAAVEFISRDAFSFDLSGGPALSPTRPSDLWIFLPIGYLVTIAIETPILIAGLSRHLTLRQRFFAGVWLTACTYPIVVLVLPLVFDSSRTVYLIVAETFAPVAECLIFWAVFKSRLPSSSMTWLRNFAVIVVANVLSFIAGEILSAAGWFGLF